MKLIMTALAALVLNFSQAAEVPTAPVLEHFKSSFTTASEVKWSFTDNLYKAEFFFNEQYASAFYDVDGNLVAVGRNVSSFQLPITLQAALKNDFKEYWLSDLFELTDNSGTTYYATIENADTKTVLRSSGAYGWATYQKHKKS